MARKLLLVDFENIQQVNLTTLDAQFNVAIYVGASKKSVPIELVTSAQSMGDINKTHWRHASKQIRH